MPHRWKFLVPAQMSLLVCVAVKKKLNFDLLTLSSGSGGVVGEEGVREGEVNNFSVILRHPKLYWASLAKEVMPYSTQNTNPQNHKESINVRIRGELYFFSTHTWCSTIQWKYCNKLKKWPRISWEYAECSTNWARINRNPRRFVMIREIFPHDSYKKGPSMLRGH